MKNKDDSCCKIINGRIVCDIDKLQIRILKELIEAQKQEEPTQTS